MFYDDWHASIVSKNCIFLHKISKQKQEDYDRLRPLSYPQTDSFILMFDVMSHHSFEQLKNKFLPEITFHCPGVPFVIGGNKRFVV